MVAWMIYDATHDEWIQRPVANGKLLVSEP